MNPHNWFYILIYISLFSFIIPLSVSYKNWKTIEKPFHILTVGILINCVIFAISIVLGIILKKNTLYLPFLDSMGSCLTFSYFYYILFVDGKIKKSIIFFSILVILILLYNLSIYFWDSRSQFSVVLESVFTVTISILFLTRIMVADANRESLLTNPFFWIILAKIIPTIFGLLITFFTEYMIVENTELFIKLYELSLLVNILGNISYGIGIWKSLKFDMKTIY